MSGFGLDPWGLGPFGGVGPLTLVGAYASGTRRVRVFCSRVPRTESATSPGDALNPATWNVSRLDTGFMFTVLYITPLTAVAFDIYTREILGDFHVTHRVSAPTLQEPGGVLITLPFSVDFPGATIAPQIARNPAESRDIANVQVPSSELFGGTFQVGSDGDLVTESGDALVKKIILRRLATLRGAFKHLPNFGLAIEPKSVMPGPALVTVREEVERQILREPEVVEVEAPLTLSADGVLTANIKARLRSGNVVELNNAPVSL